MNDSPPLWKRKRDKVGKPNEQQPQDGKRLRLVEECTSSEATNTDGQSVKTFEFESYGYLEAGGLKACAKEKIVYKSKQTDLNSMEFDNWNEEFQR